MKLGRFDDSQIIKKIHDSNCWWYEDQIEDRFNHLDRRLYFNKFYPLVADDSVNRAIILMGPRRVGKTVMIYHSIQELIKDGVDPRKIFYLSMDTPIFSGYGMEELFDYCKDAIGKYEETSGFYVFFDEIQYLEKWEAHLKTLVDNYPNCRFVVSGSAAAALKIKSNESGAGRFTDFNLPPLTFQEFIHLRDLSHLVFKEVKKWNNKSYVSYNSKNLIELNKEFIQYINYGGFPEVSLSSHVRGRSKRFVKGDIVDKVLFRDLPSLFGITDTRELNTFFTYIAFHTGNEFSLESFEKAGISKYNSNRYLEYLEAAFLIKVIRRIDQSGRRLKKGYSFKIYLTNPSLRSAIFAPIDSSSELFGSSVETAVFAQWFDRTKEIPYYAKWRDGEVDLVGLSQETLMPIWGVEVKYSNRYHKKTKELKGLLKLLRTHNIKKGIVTTIDISDHKTEQGIDIEFIPTALYCYTVGARTIRME